MLPTSQPAMSEFNTACATFKMPFTQTRASVLNPGPASTWCAAQPRRCALLGPASSSTPLYSE
eukprot:1344643-Rhodomonas_salina.1